ncbi:uncharacterized protein [Euwallacea fornicatus]|uniref:uncharacterized protein n=1 Tax=Euwallacea fornicatus TaxID=995702 RepID=UPI00338F3473
MSAPARILPFLVLILGAGAHDEDNLRGAARREIARRTQDYVRENPMSHDLQAFIERLRRPERNKRQNHNDTYALKDGEVLPPVKLEDDLVAEPNLGDNFTVAPVIVPIPLGNGVTLKKTTETAIEDSSSGSSAGSTTTGGQVVTDNGESYAVDAKLRRDRTGYSTTSPAGKTEEIVVDSLIDERLKSTSETSQLQRVLKDMQSLIDASDKGSTKEGALCNVEGYWDSESAGVTFHIKMVDGEAEVAMKSLEPASEDGFVSKDKWNISAKRPFFKSAQIVLTLNSYNERKVALFLGECRVCEGSETITGDWLVGRPSSDCKNQKASHSFVSDVFRKNNVETLREAHLKKVFTPTTGTPIE